MDQNVFFWTLPFMALARLLARAMLTTLAGRCDPAQVALRSHNATYMQSSMGFMSSGKLAGRWRDAADAFRARRE
jgi:hypothetical protein